MLNAKNVEPIMTTPYTKPGRFVNEDYSRCSNSNHGQNRCTRRARLVLRSDFAE